MTDSLPDGVFEVTDDALGVERRDVVVQCETFPASLVRLAGGLGLAIQLSLYPETEGSDEGFTKTGE